MFDINRLSSSQLVTLFNSAGGKPVARFSDKATGLKRVKAAMKELNLIPNADGTELVPAEKKASPEPEKASPAPAQEKKEPAAARKPRGMYFVFPIDEDLRKRRTVREGTNRAVIRDLLSRPEGATFEECMAATWGKIKSMPLEKQQKTTYEAIRLLHYYCGYGMRMSEGGKIHLKGK